MPDSPVVDDNDFDSIRCPRCGYDQRGTILQWSDACPLDGECTECGVRFQWGPLFRPHKFEPAWCVEFARSIRQFPRRVLATAFWTCFPWVFWKRLRMSDRVHWRRLAAYILCLVMLLCFCFVAAQTAAAMRVRSIVEQEHAADVAYNAQHLAMLQQMRGTQPTEFLKAQYAKEISILQAFLRSPAVQNLTPMEGILEANLQPFSSVSQGARSGGPWGNTVYPPPIALHGVALGNGGVTSVQDVYRQSAVAWRWLFAGLAACMGIPIGLVLLPISRRRARVRWFHPVRIAAYGLAIPVLVCSVLLILLSVRYAIEDSNPTLQSAMAHMVRWPMLLLINLWWMFAISKHLKMPRGWLVAPAFSLLSVLVVAGTVYLIWPDVLIDA